MITYINTKTNKYPYFYGDIQVDYPEYNVYQPLPDGVFPVTSKNFDGQPEPGYFWKEVLPAETDGVWTQQWEQEKFPTDNPLSGPGPWSFDEESQTWYLANPLAKAVHD